MRIGLLGFQRRLARALVAVFPKLRIIGIAGHRHAADEQGRQDNKVEAHALSAGHRSALLESDRVADPVLLGTLSRIDGDEHRFTPSLTISDLTRSRMTALSALLWNAQVRPIRERGPLQ